MTWKKGDLGRSLAEASQQPRFELLGTFVEGDDRMVRVWYGGERTSTTIPWETFKRDYTTLWDVRRVNKHALPSWLEPGARFFLYRDGQRLTQARIAGREKRFGAIKQTIDTGNQELTVRHIRQDYASCLLEDGMLVMVPTDQIRKWGYRLRSAWERILDDDDDDDDGDLFGEL